MSFQVLLANTSSSAYDITELVGATNLTECINGASTCSFTMVLEEVTPEEGNAISVRWDGVTYFAGYVFSAAFSQDRTVKVTAYDQLRYLKAQDTMVFNNLSLTQILAQLCREYGLRPGELENTRTPLGRRVYDGKQLLDILANCISLTLLATGELYYLKDEGGHVALRNIRSTISDLVLEPGSTLTGYSYSRSIDTDTFNQVKLVRDNKTTGKRELYLAKDSSTIKKWGLLQYYEKVDEGMNAAQAKAKADSLLTLKNHVGQTLTLDALGDSSLRAGHLVCVRLPEVKLDKFLLCTQVKHSFVNAGHTVSLSLRLV